MFQYLLPQIMILDWNSFPAFFALIKANLLYIRVIARILIYNLTR